MPTIVDSAPDAVRRIAFPDDDPDLSDDATTEQEIIDELQDRGEARLVDDTIANVAEAIVTEEDVKELVSGGDEIPDSDIIKSLTEVADEYGMGDRADAVADAVADEILTTDEFRELIQNQATEQEVQDAIEESDSELVGPDIEEVVEETPTVSDVLDATDETTPSRDELEDIADDLIEDNDRAGVVVDRAADETVTQEQFNSEVAQTVDQQTPDDISTGVGVLSDSDGNEVAVFGGTSPDRREQVADNLGGDVQDLGGNVNDALGSIEQVETGGGVEAQIDGRTIAEINPE